jgi:hypothetical protein
LGSKPSFARKSIHSKCDIIGDGLLWGIGDGGKVKIWGAKWLPTANTFRIQTAPNTLGVDATMGELMGTERFMGGIFS